jgi:hypothetical protein
MLAPHQTPTLIDCLLLKNSCIRYCLAAFANRCVRQQQRSEIMQCFAVIVNFFLFPIEAFRTVWRPVVFDEGPNDTSAENEPQGPHA